MDHWGQGTFTLFVSRLYRRAIGISDIEVVGLSLFPAPCSGVIAKIEVVGFHIRIQCMKVYVGQQGAHDSPLWCAGQGFCKFPVVDHTRTQKLPDEVSDVSVRYSFLDCLHQPPVRYRVEVAGYVALYDPLVTKPVVRGEAFSNVGHSVIGASIWPESIGVGAKVRFPYGFEDHAKGFLYDPVTYTGNA